MEYDENTDSYKCSVVNPDTPDLSPIFEMLKSSQLSKIPVIEPSTDDYIRAYEICKKGKCKDYDNNLTVEQKEEQTKNGAALFELVKKAKFDEVFDMLGNGKVRGYNGLNYLGRDKHTTLYESCQGGNARYKCARHLLFEGIYDNISRLVLLLLR